MRALFVFKKGRVRDRRLTIGLYIAGAFLFWVSLFIYVPTLSTYVQTKSPNLAIVGVILSMYGLAQVVVRIPLGMAADGLGRRKPFVLAGLVLAALGAWLLNISSETTGLICGRALTGLAAGAWVPLIVAFSSLFPARDAVRATTIITLASSVGRVAATGITGILNDWGGYALPFLLAAGAAGLAILLLLPVPEPRRPASLPSLRFLVSLIGRRDVLLPTLLAAMLQYVNWTATLSFIPLLVRQLGGTGVTQSLFVSMNIGVVVLGNLAAAAFFDRFGIRRSLYMGFGLLATGLVCAALATSLTVLFIGQFQLGLAEGIIYPVLMGLSIRQVAERERNTAMGLHQAVYAIGTFAGPWLSGLLAAAFGLRSMFGLTAVACLAVGFYITSRLMDH